MTQNSLSKLATETRDHTFLVEILGMTNYCNLKCLYCDWEKKKFIPLSDKELRNMRRNLLAARELIQTCWPDAPMVEYSGGEPYLYPEIVNELLQMFPERWVRVITNGLRVRTRDLEALARHGKAFLAVSLDGHIPEANVNRFPHDDLRKMVIRTIDNALDMGIPVMLLCTLNRNNIGMFSEYAQWVHRRWPEQIENGSLVLPAHKLSSYGKPHPSAAKQQWEHLREALKKLDLPGINRIREHYDAMFNFCRRCTIYRWTKSLHFLDREIVESGIFTSYRCGMRGIGKIGSFPVSSPQTKANFQEALAVAEQKDFTLYHCGCFVDWTAFDLILSGTIPMKRAAAWFRPFKDPMIQDWIAKHRRRPNQSLEDCEQKIGFP